MSDRVRIRITHRVRATLEYSVRQGYDFQWSNDAGLVTVKEVNEAGHPVWMRAYTGLVNVEWQLLDLEAIEGAHTRINP